MQKIGLVPQRKPASGSDVSSMECIMLKRSLYSRLAGTIDAGTCKSVLASTSAPWQYNYKAHINVRPSSFL